MKKTLFRDSLPAILGIIALLLLIAYFLTIGEKYRLKADLARVQKRSETLEKERRNLLQQLEKQKEIHEQLDEQSRLLGTTPEGRKDEIIIIQPATDTRYAEAQRIIEELNGRLASLKEENQALKEKETQLNAQLANLSQENSILKARLNSLPELKKAIKEVRLRMRQMSLSLKKREKREYIVIGGNKGYLIKDGRLTSSSKVRIEVKPVLSPANVIP